LKYAGEYYQGSHKTFISKKLFDEVQKQVEKIERPRQKGHNFAFAGLATCGECGAAITAEQRVKKYKNGTGQTFIYYRCTKKRGACAERYISETAFATQIKSFLQKVSLSSQDTKKVLAALEQDEKQAKEEARMEAETLKGELAQIETKLEKLLNLYTS